METESQDVLESQDALRNFCETYIAQNSEKWPTNENTLADGFVKHFKIPFLGNVRDLQDFLVRTNIEFVESNLPADLLGVNMSFEGKRRIISSINADHFLFRVHTVLHEIREIIEADFLELGFATTASRDLDSLADEFACAVFLSSVAFALDGLLETAGETDSKWQQWLSFGLILICAGAIAFYSFFAAFGYRFPKPSRKRRL